MCVYLGKMCVETIIIATIICLLNLILLILNNQEDAQ